MSNFFPHLVEIDGDAYPTNEYAFQALKTDDPAEREKVRLAKTPASAKSLCKRVVRVKFADPDLAEKLLATGERESIEGNNWRDTMWGCVRGQDGEWKGQR